MSTLETAWRVPHPPIELQNGDRMNREEFHSAYEQAPKHFHAELIGGIVHVPSPLRVRHSNNHGHLGMLFSIYELRTPGTQFGDNATVKLGNESEPQPDLFLRILPEFGGQSTTDRQDYVVGPPELIAEVAQSSRAIDLHAKRDDYARNGVSEYLVMSLTDRRFFWFDLPGARELPLPQDGVIRVRCFPGFWIDVNALFNADGERMISTLQQGIASDEHARFVSQLASVKKTA